jgi:hypothetical protein
MTPRPEAQAAARWWTDTITGKFGHDLGDAESNAAHAVTAPRPAGHSWTSEQVDAFRADLAEHLEALCAATQWQPNAPTTDSVNLWCDYGPDERLTMSARAVGLDLRDGDVPSKTWMHIYPGVVIVSVGYTGKPHAVWPTRSGPYTRDQISDNQFLINLAESCSITGEVSGG